MKKLSLKHKATIVYFILSFAMLSISDETPIVLIFIVVLNFANAARLIKKVRLTEEE